MKILRIIARLNVGGPARHVVWLTEAFNRNGHHSILLAGRVPDGEEDMSYFASRHGVTPIYIKEMSRELSPKDAVSLFKVFRAMMREKPDIVHTHTAKAGTIGRSAAFLYRWLTLGTLVGKPRRVRIVHTFHGHVFHSYYCKAKTRFFLGIERMLARIATDRIVVITPQQLKEIHSTFRVGRESQFDVIPLGIDVGRFAGHNSTAAAIRKELGVADPDILLIGFVGRLTEIKNIPMFLEAARKYIAEPSARPARFVIVGDGNIRESTERLVRELGLVDSVILTGNREDVEAAYAALDIVALTSLNEGTPLSLIEAMASERPVISTAVGGVVDLLGKAERELDGFVVCERGISVASGNAEGFAKGLLYLAKDEKLRGSLSEKGRRFVGERYGKERLIEDIEALYSRLVASD